MVEVGIERPTVMFITQVKLDTRVDRTDPRTILVVLYIPLPVERVRRHAAGTAQAQFIRRSLMTEWQRQLDIAHMRCRGSGQRNVVAQRAISLQAGLDFAL